MSNPQSNARRAASVTIHDDPELYRGLEDEILGAASACGYDETSVFAIRLALEEAVVNGFKHGNRGKPGETVDVEWAIDERAVRIVVEDRGPGFAPDDVPDPREPEYIERPSGRGLMLMRAYMTRVEHNEAGNRVTMIYEKPAG